MDPKTNRSRHKKLAAVRAKKAAPPAQVIIHHSFTDELMAMIRVTYNSAGRLLYSSFDTWLKIFQRSEDPEAEAQKWATISLSLREYVAEKKPALVDRDRVIKVINRLVMFADGQLKFDERCGLTRNESQLAHTCWFRVIAHSKGKADLISQKKEHAEAN